MFKYKKGDILKVGEYQKIIVIDINVDGNGYEVYKVADFDGEKLETQWVDKNLLESSSEIDKKYLRNKKLKIILNGLS